MKGDVGFVKGVRVLAVFFHGVETGLNSNQIDGSGAFGSPARNSRFDQATHIQQRANQFRVFFLLQRPGEHVGIEVVPLFTRHDQQAAMWLGVDQALGRQHFDDFTHDIA